MHIIAAPSRERFALAEQRMADDRVANLDALNRVADGFDPTGILMPHDVRKSDRHAVAPQPLDNVKVGAADARATDADDDVSGGLNAWFRHFLQGYEFGPAEGRIVAVQDRRLHDCLTSDQRVRVDTAGGIPSVSGSISD